VAEENKIFPGVKPLDFDGPEVPAWIRGGASVLNDLGNIVAGSVDRTPVGAATNWLDRNTGNYLGKLDTAFHNLLTGENLSLAENRKRRADTYAQTSEKNPKTAFAANLGAGFADPVGQFRGILGLLGAGGAYGTAYGYADAVDKADREMQPVSYDKRDAGRDAAIGATLTGVAHGAINNPLSRKGIDWTTDKILNSRNILADAMRRLTPIPEWELKAVNAFRNAEGKNPGVTVDDIKKALKSEKTAMTDADFYLKRAKKSGDPASISEAEAEYADAFQRYRAKRKEFSENSFEGTPAEQQMAQVNPARRYSEETGASRGRLGENYNPEKVASPELLQARIVMRNSGLEDKVANQRAMWRGDKELRASGLGQTEAEDIYSRLAKGTEDPLTGSGAARSDAQMGQQGTIFEQNKQKMFREADEGFRYEDTPASRFLRPEERPDPLQKWTQEQRNDLTKLVRDPEYAANALAGSAEATTGSMTAAQQQDIARRLTQGSKVKAAIANTLGKAKAGTFTGTVSGSMIAGPVGAGVGGVAGGLVDEALKKVTATKSVPQGTRALGRELDKALKKINGLPETGRFYEPNPFQQHGGILAARMAQQGWNNNSGNNSNSTPGDVSGQARKSIEKSAQFLDQYRTGRTANEIIDSNPDLFPKRSAQEAVDIIQNYGKPKKKPTANEIISSNPALFPKRSAQENAQIIKRASEPDFWDGIGKILAGIISMKTGARFDYNINDRIKSLQEDYGMSRATAESVAADRNAYQKLIAQKEDAREKDRIAQRNAALQAGQPQKMEIRTLSDGTVLGINPYTGEKTVIQQGSGTARQLSPQQQSQLGQIDAQSRQHMANGSMIRSFSDDLEKVGDYYAGFGGRQRFLMDEAAYASGRMSGDSRARFELAAALEGRRGILVGQRAKQLGGANPSEKVTKLADRTVPSIFQPYGAARNHVADMLDMEVKALELLDKDRNDVLNAYGSYATTKNGTSYREEE